MNQHLRSAGLPIPLEGVSRRKWTDDDVVAMVKAGILYEGDRVELVAGEIIAMPSKGARHEIVRTELTTFWSDRRPKDVKIVAEAPLNTTVYAAGVAPAPKDAAAAKALIALLTGPAAADVLAKQGMEKP